MATVMGVMFTACNKEDSSYFVSYGIENYKNSGNSYSESMPDDLEVISNFFKEYGISEGSDGKVYGEVEKTLAIADFKMTISKLDKSVLESRITYNPIFSYSMRVSDNEGKSEIVASWRYPE